ncbi:hypothetical protein VM1G_06473 [Cytospora mali]|uniref:Uncharacterized protein n=1 Tax=Cytospora mali TaxID=578113 RepID=A0A194W3K8_CYTMA|nr:hypothetical protein VM1G_06473 [Valsa mali]
MDRSMHPTSGHGSGKASGIHFKHTKVNVHWTKEHLLGITKDCCLPAYLNFSWDGLSNVLLRLQVTFSIKTPPSLPPETPSSPPFQRLYIIIYPESMQSIELRPDSSVPEEILDFHLADSSHLHVLGNTESVWEPADSLGEAAVGLFYDLGQQRRFSLCFPKRIVSRSALQNFCTAASAGQLSTRKDADPQKSLKGRGGEVRDLDEPVPAYSESSILQDKGKKRRCSIDESAEEQGRLKRPCVGQSWAEKDPGLEVRVEKLEQLLQSLASVDQQFPRISSVVEQLPDFAKHVNLQFSEISGVVGKVPDFAAYVDRQFSEISSIVEKIPELEARVEKLLKSVDSMEEQTLRISGVVGSLAGSGWGRRLDKLETGVKRLDLAVSEQETRREQMFRSLELRAMCILEGLRQEISQARVSEIVDSRVITYMASARNWYRHWRRMAMAGNAVIQQAVRKVWRE